MGKLRDPAPRFVGNIIAWLLNLVRGRGGMITAQVLVDYYYVCTSIDGTRTFFNFGSGVIYTLCIRWYTLYIPLTLFSTVHGSQIGPKGLEFAK